MASIATGTARASGVSVVGVCGWTSAVGHPCLLLDTQGVCGWTPVLRGCLSLDTHAVVLDTDRGGLLLDTHAAVLETARASRGARGLSVLALCSWTFPPPALWRDLSRFLSRFLDIHKGAMGVVYSARDAMMEAGERRLRPILMTALATMAGMIPLSLAIGAGSQMLQPLAIAVIGGLLASLVLSLIVTPAVHYYLSPRD